MTLSVNESMPSFLDTVFTFQQGLSGGSALAQRKESTAGICSTIGEASGHRRGCGAQQISYCIRPHRLRVLTLATSGELEKHCLVPTPEIDVMVLRGCLAWEAGKAPQGVLMCVAGVVHCCHRWPLPPAVGLRTASAGPAETNKREQESSGYECISVHEGICLCQSIHRALSKRKTTIFFLDN